VILGLVNDAVAAGARRERACLQVGLAERSVQRWRRAEVGDDRRAGPRTSMANASAMLCARDSLLLNTATNSKRCVRFGPKTSISSIT
jgi:hypothetical protein